MLSAVLFSKLNQMYAIFEFGNVADERQNQ